MMKLAFLISIERPGNAVRVLGAKTALKVYFATTAHTSLGAISKVAKLARTIKHTKENADLYHAVVLGEIWTIEEMSYVQDEIVNYSVKAVERNVQEFGMAAGTSFIPIP